MSLRRAARRVDATARAGCRRAMAVDAAARALAIDGAALACSTTRSTLPVRLEMLEGRGEEGKGEVQGSTDDGE